jgi:hypothetical protein
MCQKKIIIIKENGELTLKGNHLLNQLIDIA